MTINKRLHPYYDAIYLSPHLDDVALSCGGQVYQATRAGKRVLIVTITAGTPSTLPLSGFVEELHQRWQLERESVAARRAEDVAACEILDAGWLHWEFLDCVYRYDQSPDRPLYPSVEAIFGEIHPAEQKLALTIAGKMEKLPACGRVLTPLTLGHHVDHQLTRLAAEYAFSPPNLLYYEDYPYAGRFNAESFLANEEGQWNAEVIPLNEEDLAAKIQAVACYHSQLSTFFKDREDLERQIRSFTQPLGGERVWYRRNG